MNPTPMLQEPRIYAWRNTGLTSEAIKSNMVFVEFLFTTQTIAGFFTKPEHETYFLFRQHFYY